MRGESMMKNKSVESLRKWYKENHICIQCGQRNAVRGKTACAQCLADDAERHRQAREHRTEEQIENDRQCRRSAYQKLREERAKQGLCLYCGKRKPTDHSTTCEYCRAKKRNYMSKYRVEHGIEPHAVRLMPGLCYKCKAPALKGFKVCQYHYDELVRMSKIGKMNGSTNKWRKDMKNLFVR